MIVSNLDLKCFLKLNRARSLNPCGSEHCSDTVWHNERKVCACASITSNHVLLPAACPVLASSPPSSRMLCSLTRTASSSLSWMSRFTTTEIHTHNDVFGSVLTRINHRDVRPVKETLAFHPVRRSPETRGPSG